jgi:hypothetical protein
MFFIAIEPSVELQEETDTPIPSACHAGCQAPAAPGRPVSARCQKRILQKSLRLLRHHYFANAKAVVLVQDNLNIHGKGSLYDAFPAAEARRLVERFEWHYTPKHGSWLDLAESELGVLTSQCLNRRIADKQTLVEEIAAWEHDRNANHTKANWQFSTQNARIKLKHLYPAI